MSRDPARARDDQLSRLLAAYHDTLRRGAGPDPALEAAVPPELRGRFRRAAACLRLLEQELLRSTRAPVLEVDLRGLLLRPAGPAGAARPPRRLARFLLLRELGRGGYGIVYLARDARTGQEVALKVPLPEVLVTDELRNRFLREAQAAAGLSHPNLVPVLEADRFGPFCYLTMTYCPGPTLAEWLARQTSPVPARTAADLVADLARGVQYLHDRQIWHRDLKPANIMLEEAAGEQAGLLPGKLCPKITDFGLAKLREAEAESTRSGVLVGTPAYMAPEQAQGRRHDMGPATDVYALGAILYELLTGQPPFRGATHLDTLHQVLTDEPLALRRLRGGLHRDLETICLKCLAKEPGGRYASAAALADDLDRFVKGLPIRTRRPGPGRKLLRWARRQPGQAALAALSGVALLGLTVGSVLYGAQQARHSAEQEAALRREQEQAREVQTNRDTAERERRIRGEVYASVIRTAAESCANGQFDRAAELLNSQRPRAGDPDLRGFEWGLLSRRMHPEGLALVNPPSLTLCGAISRDGQSVIVGADRCVRVWGLTNRTLDHEFGGGRHVVQTVAISPDGYTVAWGTGEGEQVGELLLWDRRTAKLIGNLIAQGKPGDADWPPGPVASVGFSPDGRNLAAAFYHRGPIPPQVRVWDLAARRVVAQLKPGRGAEWFINGLAYAPDRGVLSLACSDGKLRDWDPASGQTRDWPDSHWAEAVAVAYSPRGDRVVTGGLDGHIIIRTRRSREALKLPGFSRWIKAVAFSPDGKVIASGNMGKGTGNMGQGTVELWDARSGRRLAVFPAHAEHTIRALAFTPDGKTLVTASEPGSVMLWDLSQVQPYLPLQKRGKEAWAVAFAPDGKTVCSAGDDHLVKLWDAATGRPLAVLAGPETLVSSVAFSPDGQTLAAGDYHNNILLWDVRTRRVRLTLRDHWGPLRSLAFSPDGRTLASAGMDKVIKLWDATTGRERATLLGHEGRVRCVAFAPDGKTLASASEDGTIRLWDPATGKARLSLPDKGEVWTLAFSPDGKTLVAGNKKDRLSFWDTTTWVRRTVPTDHEGGVHCLAFSPDGKTLVSGGRDGSIQLWQGSTGEPLFPLERHQGPVNAVTFSPDGRTLASAGHDGSVRLWRAAREP